MTASDSRIVVQPRNLEWRSIHVTFSKDPIKHDVISNWKGSCTNSECFVRGAKTAEFL